MLINVRCSIKIILEGGVTSCIPGQKMKVGILGCGYIGKTLAEAIDKGIVNCDLTSVFDKDIEKAADLAHNLEKKPEVVRDIYGLIERTDLVIEAASQDAVREFGIRILRSGRDLMIMSVGALSDDNFFTMIKEVAERKKQRVYIPSGAILGLDGLNSAKIANLDSVTIITRKNPESLGVSVNKETILYDGAVRNGIRKFPRNVNVAATLSLAGIGFEKTRLRIIADPKVKRNQHEIHVIGDFGEFSVSVNNNPSPENPRTSYLAALSAIATLKNITEPIRIGN